MPLYPFACNECDLEFDVSREDGDLDRPAQCPLDSATAIRVQSISPMQRADGSEVERRQSISWASFLHAHGPGSMPHLHGPGTPFHRR